VSEATIDLDMDSNIDLNFDGINPRFLFYNFIDFHVFLLIFIFLLIS